MMGKPIAIAAILLAMAAGLGSAHAISSAVTLDPLPPDVYAGQPVVFSGTLTGNGVPLPGRTVWICEDDPFIPDECLARTTTDSRGQYHTVWTAEAGIVERDFDIYAEFRGDGSYERDQTIRHTMSVYKYGGSLVLDPVPALAAYGEAVTFSGTLQLDAHSPEGAVVYIKDEDTLNPDDLLVSAYVDASGSFTTHWIVEDVDPDYTIDIQAVYEGGPLYYRIATPIQDLRAYNGTQEPGPVGGSVYMELYRSLDFERPPRVAIVPSPDSYEQVRKHIVPVQEGILGLTAMLERAYPAGDWNVDFEVVAPGERFSVRPDVTIDLVTRDDTRGDDWNCDDSWGWASTASPKPVPTTVCSLDHLTNAQIGATAVHEFVHAIGLGHTFNLSGDLMCSVEDGRPTCPVSSPRPKSTVFSDFNLAALVTIYGTDGFQNPNNQIDRGARITPDGTVSNPAPGGYGTNPGDTELDAYWECEERAGYYHAEDMCASELDEYLECDWDSNPDVCAYLGFAYDTCTLEHGYNPYSCTAEHVEWLAVSVDIAVPGDLEWASYMACEEASGNNRAESMCVREQYGYWYCEDITNWEDDPYGCDRQQSAYDSCLTGHGYDPGVCDAEFDAYLWATEYGHPVAEVTNAAGSSVPGCEETNECFIPYMVTIDVGGEVIWSNSDLAAHTVTSGVLAEGGHDGVFGSGLFSPGVDFSHTFDEAGTYPYFCLVHPWMVGMVIVQETVDGYYGGQ